MSPLWFSSLLCVLNVFLPIHAAPTSNTTRPIVTLEYGTFQGATSTQYNLAYWRRIPFGASTAGKNRFRAPQPPDPITNGTYNSDRDFDMCPQRTVNGSEDCLYLAVSGRPWTQGQPLRPVLMNLYGGGFIRGSANQNIPPSTYPTLTVNTQNDFLTVYPNYRTNVMGFLPGSKIAQHPDTDLNPGLLDQQAALRWIQKYIVHFGGDPKNVTIWGQSAGGGSVLAQTIAAGNRGKGYFSKALASSPFWPKTYRYDAPESEELFAQTAEAVGCSGAADEVACLKSADLQRLRDVALSLSSSQVYTTSSFVWGPVIDDSFLTKPLSDVVRNGSLNAQAVLASYNLHEGENFIPPGFQSANGSSDGFNSSIASFNVWLRGFLPNLTSADVVGVQTQYPPVGTAEQLNYSSTYERAGLVYRDLVLACPAYELAKKAANGWLVEYTIAPAKHASDVQYWNTVGTIQQSDSLTYHGYTGALASFVQTGDPNAHKVTPATEVGVPALSEGKQFLVTGALEHGPVDQLASRCAFWSSVADRVSL